MAGSLIFVDERLHSWESAYADTASSTSNIYEGDFVTRQGQNACHISDPASDADVAGIVPHLDRGDHLPEHQFDYTEPQYQGDGTPSASDRVQFAPMEELSKLYPWTPHDSAAPAPSINRNDAVGIILMDGSNYGSARPVVVEEGYTASPSGTSITYNAANNNWIRIGEANESKSGHEELVEVRVDEA